MNGGLLSKFNLYLLAYFLFSIAFLWLFKVSFSNIIFYSLFNLFLSASLLNYRLQFLRESDFFNKRKANSIEEESIIVTGQKIITSSEESDSEDRFMRVGSQKNRLRGYFALFIYLFIIIIFYSKAVSQLGDSRAFISLVMGGILLSRSNTLGHLLCGPFISFFALLFLSTESIQFSLPFFIFTISLFFCLTSYSHLDKESSFNQKVKKEEFILVLKKAIISGVSFFLLWASFNFLHDLFLSSKKEVKLEEKIEKQLKRINKRKKPLSPEEVLQRREALEHQLAELSDLENGFLNKFSKSGEMDQWQKNILNQIKKRKKDLSSRIDLGELDATSLNSMRTNNSLKESALFNADMMRLLGRQNAKSGSAFSPQLGDMPFSFDLSVSNAVSSLEEGLMQVDSLQGSLKDDESLTEESRNYTFNSLEESREALNNLLGEVTKNSDFNHSKVSKVETELAKVDELRNSLTKTGESSLAQDYRQKVSNELVDYAKQLASSFPEEAKNFEKTAESYKEDSNLKPLVNATRSLEVKRQKIKQKKDHFFSPEKIKKLSDFIVIMLKVLLALFVFSIIGKLLRGKKKILSEQGGLDEEEYKRLTKKTRYRSSIEEVIDLYKKFSEANKAVFFQNEEVPPPKTLENFLNRELAEQKKPLRFLVEIFSFGQYGGYKISGKNLKSYRKAFRRLMKQYKK